jgi:hypothetical protein
MSVPLRFTTLHLAQIFFTDGLTFIGRYSFQLFDNYSR